MFLSRKTLSFFVLGVFLFGCAASTSQMGQRALKKGDYARAIAVLQKAVRENPHNAVALRDLGIAYFKKGNWQKAIVWLEKAHRQIPKDGATLFYLGASYEKNHQIKKAIQVYRQYTRLGRFSKTRQLVKAQLHVLLKKEMAQEIKQAVQNESALQTRQIPPNSVAVLYFKNVSDIAELKPLTKGLADMMITDLSQVHTLQVVERARLQALMQEIGLGMSGLVDPKTAPKLGKLLGASRFVNGALVTLPGQKIQLDYSIARTQNARIEKTGDVNGSLRQIFSIEKKLVFDVIADMGIRLTEAERKAIQQIPTENLMAFIAYSRGLDYADRGKFDLAKKEFKRAVQLDPHFKKAQIGLAEVQISSGAVNAVDLAEPEVLATVDKTPQSSEQVSSDQTAKTPTVSSKESILVDRVTRSAQSVGVGFVPGVEQRKPVQESSGTEAAIGSARVNVNVPVPID